MAVTQISFCRVGRFEFGSVLPAVETGYGVTSETIAPDGTSKTTTASAPATPTGGGSPWARVATDTAVYVSFGTAPDATSDTSRLMVPANAVEYFGVTPGHKISVTTA